MPSAVPSKLTKQSSNAKSIDETGIDKHPTDASQAIEESIKNKIRNLEKRKVKLDSYEQDLKKGKQLTKDQEEATKHIGTVEQQLESLRELLVTIQDVVKDFNKQRKAVKKAEQKERVQTEIGRIRELLRIQDCLNSLGNDDVRKDFKSGTNGAVTLSEVELQKLDELYKKICPSYEDLTEQQSWPNALNEGSLITYSFLTYSTNAVPFFEKSTYKDVRLIVDKVIECGYFDSKQGRSQSPEQAKSEIASTTSNSEDNRANIEQHQDERRVLTNLGQNVIQGQQANLPSFNGGSIGAVIMSAVPGRQSSPAGLIAPGVHSNISFIQEDQSGNLGYGSNAAGYDGSAINASLSYQPDSIQYGNANLGNYGSAALLYNQQQTNVPQDQLAGYGGGSSLGNNAVQGHFATGVVDQKLSMKPLDPNAPTFVSQADATYATSLVSASSQIQEPVNTVNAQYIGSSTGEEQRLSQEPAADENNAAEFGSSQYQNAETRGRGGRGGDRGNYSARGGRGSFRGGYSQRGGDYEQRYNNNWGSNEGGYRGGRGGGGYRGGYKRDDYGGRGGRGGGGGRGGYGPSGGYENRGGNTGGYRGRGGSGQGTVDA